MKAPEAVSFDRPPRINSRRWIKKSAERSRRSLYFQQHCPNGFLRVSANTWRAFRGEFSAARSTGASNGSAAGLVTGPASVRFHGDENGRAIARSRHRTTPVFTRNHRLRPLWFSPRLCRLSIRLFSLALACTRSEIGPPVVWTRRFTAASSTDAVTSR